MDNIKLENVKTTDNTERYRIIQNRKKRIANDKSLSSISIKIGLCIAICIALCIINLIQTPNQSANNTYEDDDSPGKLRFVELPSIIEVFAGGDELTMPIGQYTEAELDDNNILTLKSSSNATVVTCSSGTVKAIGTDDELGAYVVIHHGDIETYYYGLGHISVEERQIINKLDTLGLLTQSGILRFKICKDGKIQDPREYLPIAK